MTDYTDLIERLHDKKVLHINEEGYTFSEHVNPDGPEAADALKAQAKRIEEQSEIIERQNIIINELRMLNAFESALEKDDE